LRLFFKGGLRRGTRIDIELMTKHLLDSNNKLNFFILPDKYYFEFVVIAYEDDYM